MNFLRIKSKFGKNVLTLMTGTTLAQAIPIAITPVLTRIYAPEDFGVFSLFMAMAGVLAIFGTGRYELAIMQPSCNDDAGHVFMLATLLASVWSLAVFVGVFFFGEVFSELIGWPDIFNWLYLLPLMIFLFGLYNCFNYLLNRKEHYTQISKNKIIQSGAASFASIVLGFMGAGSLGLLLGVLVGHILTIFILFPKYFSELPKFNALKAKLLAHEYKNYPTFDMPAAFFGVFAQKLPSIMFVPLFGAASSGYYYLVERILLAPISLISGSVGAVFRQTALQTKQTTGSYDKLFIKTFTKLVYVGVPIFLIVGVLSPRMFTFIFGEDWIVAGEFTQILAPMFFIKFISSPLSFSFYVSNKLHYDLVGQVTYFVLLVLSILVGYSVNNYYISVIALSASGVFLYTGYLVVSFRLSREK